MPESIEEIDQALEMLRNAMWALPDALGERGVDQDGTRFSADLSEIVLREDARTAIMAARAAAVQAIAENPDGDAQRLLPYAELVRTELARFTLLLARWSLPEIRRAHMHYMEPLLAQAPEAERQQYLARLKAIEARIVEVRQLAAGPQPVEALATGRFKETLAAIADTYNAVRVELVQRRSGSGIPQLLTAAFRERDTACPEPALPKAADSGLSVRKSVDPGSYYPPELQHFSIEGVVRVEIFVSPEGCVTKVRTEQSSGVPELDEAAELVALQMQMHPASEAGRAVAATSILPVRFKLLDAPWPMQPVPPSPAHEP